MSFWLMDAIAGVKRKLVKLQGSVKPLSAQDTTVPKWITTPPYDPLNGEVLVGLDGPDRIQLAADGKIYPPLCAGGYPPGKQTWSKPNAYLEIKELPAGAATPIGVDGFDNEGCIVIPPTATLTRNAVTMAAPGVTIVIPINTFLSAQIVTAGVASCWWIGTRRLTTTEAIVSR